MRKDRNWVFWFSTSLLLFGAGAVWSPLFVSAVNDAKSIFEVLSYVATIAAAFVAIFSLNAWRKQFYVQSKHEGLRALKSAYFELRNFGPLIKAHAAFRKSEELDDDDIKVTELKEKLQSRYEEWLISYIAYAKVWAEYSHLISDVRAFEDYTPDYVRAIYPTYSVLLDQKLLLSSDVAGICDSHVREEVISRNEYFEIGDKLYAEELKSTFT